MANPLYQDPYLEGDLTKYWTQEINYWNASVTAAKSA